MLKDHVECLLRGANPLFNHVIPLNMALESDYLEALAAFLEARKGDLPAQIADDIVWSVHCIVTTCKLKMDHPWGLTEIYLQLESKGILKQFLRCLGVPLVHIQCESRLLEGLAGLLSFRSLAFVKKKFRKGTPCGEVIRALLDEGTYREIRPHITPYLQLLVKYSSTRKDLSALKICGFCRIVDESEEYQCKMKECSNCGADYCSEKCQKADWKEHKKRCKSWTALDSKNMQVVKLLCANFCQDHYFDIMIKMVQVCDETGLQKKDMLLEISFVPDSKGYIPVLQDPPQFQIIPARSYIDGSRFLEPDWIHVNKETKEMCAAKTKRDNSKISETTGLSICSVHIWRPHWYGHHQRGGQYNNDFFTQEALDAFGSAMKEKDYAPLIILFGAAMTKKFRTYLTRAYPHITFAA